MKKYFLTILALSMINITFYSLAKENSNVAVSWDSAKTILSGIKELKFPDRDFIITDYGAVAGSSKDSTGAIAKAIDACSKAGGGRVVVPSGVFLTGAIHLKSNVDIYLAEGSILKFSTDPKSYLPVVFTRWEGIECMNYSPFIYAYKENNIAVTGKGILDGSANDNNWWKWAEKDQTGKSPAMIDAKLQNQMADNNIPPEQRVFGEGHYLRPNFFQPYLCTNVMIEGVTFKNSPMWEVHPALCNNVIVRGLTISSHGPNNDGCDPESCKNVLIENCVFDTGDDCIAIKSGRNDDGRRVGVPSENIIIRNCTMKDGHGGVVLGSECSGGIRNVFIENCNMDSPNLERALRIKNNAKRGGLIENIFMRNVKIGQVVEAVVSADYMYEEGPNGKFVPILRNVFLENITGIKIPRMFFLRAYKGAVIDNINLKNCTFSGLSSSEIIEFAGRIVLDNVTAESAEKVESLSTRANTL
jgi:unsaturated rhamnogalacturonyl hydrolase